jgi:hypothetical protein
MKQGSDDTQCLYLAATSSLREGAFECVCSNFVQRLPVTADRDVGVMWVQEIGQFHVLGCGDYIPSHVLNVER